MGRIALLEIEFIYDSKLYKVKLSKFSYELWVYDFHTILEGALGLFAADIKQKSWKQCGVNPAILQAALNAIWNSHLKSDSYKLRYNAIKLIITRAYGNLAYIHMEKLNEKAGLEK